MSMEAWVELGKWSILVGGAAAVWLWTRGETRGRIDSTDQTRLVALERWLVALERRMDKAGAEMSDLATKLQGFEPPLLRRIDETYLPRREATILLEESRHDRAQLWLAIDRLRTRR